MNRFWTRRRDGDQVLHSDDEYIELSQPLSTATSTSKDRFRHVPETDALKRHRDPYGPSLAETSRRAQELNPPIFIPSLPGLRQKCFNHITDQLLGLERSLGETIPDDENGRLQFSRATELLSQMDRWIDLEIRRIQLESPEYAASQGMSVLRFEKRDAFLAGRSGSWTMLSKTWGQQSKSIIDTVSDDTTSDMVMSKWHQAQIKNFMHVTSFASLRTWSSRLKQTHESKFNSLIYSSDGSIRMRYGRIWRWRFMILIAELCLVIFYGVGIIATNSTFSETFQKYFFWIAIVWSLVSSFLLAGVVVALGATRRDAVYALISGLGLWLVVIQIGQTRLITQVSDDIFDPNRNVTATTGD